MEYLNTNKNINAVNNNNFYFDIQKCNESKKKKIIISIGKNQEIKLAWKIKVKKIINNRIFIC